MNVLLKIARLEKTFGTLPVFQDFELTVFQNEIVGLAGLNGSGKSVLTRILAGLETPDAGTIEFEGRRLRFPLHPQQANIEIVHQRPNLVEHLDITSSVFLGRELTIPFSRGWLNLADMRGMDRETQRILTQLNAHFSSLREKVANLSREQRQLLAIAHVMTTIPKLIIIDEPTNALNHMYQQKLLSLIPEWRTQGSTIMFFSTNLDHLFAVSDRIVVLRNGRCVKNSLADKTNREEIVAAMLGVTDQRQFTPAIWAMDNYYRAREQTERLRDQQLLLKQNLEEQGSINRQLVDQLSEQVKALDEANLALQEAHRRVLTEREHERKRLARELHDQVIQDLLSVIYQVEELEGFDSAPTNLTNELGVIRNDLREFVSDLRRICSNLRPPTIDSLGLAAALQSYLQSWHERTGIKVTLSLAPSFGRLPESIELNVFRIIQEGLSNVRKHAEAQHVWVTLEHSSPRTLKILIEDDGNGLNDDFDLSALSASGHFGLLGISERVALLGGRVKLQHGANSGLALEIEIPHPRPVVLEN